MAKSCVICGKPSGMYPLCTEHLQMKQKGEVVKCENCGTWHLSKEQCKCEKNVSNDVVEKNVDDFELSCIICGNNSNGKHFCRSCYSKYKDRSVDIRITNCRDVSILDEYGNKTIKCVDGHYVRSRAEAMIVAWFWDKRIRVIYEECIYYIDKETGETKELHPDFYLPDYDLYIEYNELSGKKYLKSKEYVMNIYKEKNKKVLIITDEELNDISKFLCPKLGI